MELHLAWFTSTWVLRVDPAIEEILFVEKQELKGNRDSRCRESYDQQGHGDSDGPHDIWECQKDKTSVRQQWLGDGMNGEHRRSSQDGSARDALTRLSPQAASR